MAEPTTSGVLRWEEPPPAQSGGKGIAKNVIAHELIAVQLKRRADEWAVVHEGRGLNSLAMAIKKGEYAPYRPAGSFEATTRWQNDKLVTFARYIGHPDG